MLGAFLAAAAMAADPAPPARLATHYSLKLNAVLTPESRTQGLYFKARIDGGPLLRLLLDSGAQHIVLGWRAAAKVGRKAGSGFELVGVGAAAKSCRRTRPGTLQIDDLVLENCPILAVDGPLMDGIDGIIPLSLFADFLVRLDIPGKTLELDAYPADPPAPNSGDLPVRTDNHLLFIRSLINDKQPGYILLDTGATFSAVSPDAARASRNYWSLTSTIGLRGSAGDIEGYPLPPGVRFRFGDRVLSADPAVVVDLSDFASHHHFDVTGILGYPALRYSIVTIDYRDSLVRIEGK
ncbi:MAG TPA: aspartyl protease family protein [Bryobacteraceae bacterium]|nr:aspartyl protease family protein [Bryobacteraceae bacterium]